MVGSHSGRSDCTAQNISAALCAPPITATRYGRSLRSSAIRCRYCVLWITRSCARPAQLLGDAGVAADAEHQVPAADRRRRRRVRVVQPVSVPSVHTGLDRRCTPCPAATSHLRQLLGHPLQVTGQLDPVRHEAAHVDELVEPADRVQVVQEGELAARVAQRHQVLQERHLAQRLGQQHSPLPGRRPRPARSRVNCAPDRGPSSSSATARARFDGPAPIASSSTSRFAIVLHLSSVLRQEREWVPQATDAATNGSSGVAVSRTSDSALSSSAAQSYGSWPAQIT